MRCRVSSAALPAVRATRPTSLSQSTGTSRYCPLNHTGRSINYGGSMATLARWCFRHRYTVVLLWLAALVGLGVVNSAVGTGNSDNFALPGTESTKALNLLQSAFPAG